MSVVDDVKARLDMVDIASGYVDLRKSGRYFKATCPFHTEKTPSFIVNPERQSWHCFGACATGGDVFSFVSRMERLDFGATLRLLADKTGIDLSPRRDGDRNEALFRVNQAAAKFYRDVLASAQGRYAMAYLAERGVNAEAMGRFELGLSPTGWEGLKKHLTALGVSEGRAVDAGLLHRGQDGGTRDFFHGRLMFPIHDRQGRVAGFGGRALDDSNPKYLNTSTTSIFDKSGTLYGLPFAADSMRTQRIGVVVEGYMDVIAAHQHGYTDVVASMGTALTEQQVSQLKSLATSFVLALDPDAAGQEATLRSLLSSWFDRQGVGNRPQRVGVLYQREPLAIKIAPLPPGRDPDTVIRESPDEWERLTREAVPLMDYLIPAVASRFDLSSTEGKSQVVQTLAPFIVGADFVEQEPYLRKLAQAIDVSEDALKASIGGLRSRGPRRADRRPTPDAGNAVTSSALRGSQEDALEDYTLSLLLSQPELREMAQAFKSEYFHKSEHREVFTRWLSSTTMDELRSSLDESLHGHLEHLESADLLPTDRGESEAALAQCLRRLEKRRLQELQESLLASEDAGAPPPRELEGAIADVNARMKELDFHKV